MTTEIQVHSVRASAGTEILHLDESDFVERPCPICGEADASILLSMVCAGSRTSVESAFCERCEHRYHRKMPSADWVASYYADDWDRGKSAPYSFMRRWREQLKAHPKWGRPYNAFRSVVRGEDEHFRYLRGLLEGITDGRGGYLLPNSDVRRVLEIGCGYGDKLLLFRRLGFSVVGQEANATRAALCRRLGIPVMEHDVAVEGELDRAGPFDLIFSTHVLEHVTNTVEHLKGFARLLREGGYVFIEVPDFWQGEGLIRQTHGIAHCQTFTAHSLVDLLRRVGLQPVRVAADTNLYVVARKLSTGEGLGGPAFSASGSPEALLQPFAGWAQKETGPCRITYDPARLEVERISDGEKLKTLAQNFSVRQFPTRDSLDVSVRLSAPEVKFPVRFLYDGASPPIWVKRQ